MLNLWGIILWYGWTVPGIAVSHPSHRLRLGITLIDNYSTNTNISEKQWENLTKK